MGTPAWTPPPWARALGRGFQAYRAWHAARHRQFWVLHALLFLLVAAGIAGYAWYQSRPRPPLVTATVSDPPATVVEEELYPNPAHIIFSDSVAPLEQVGGKVTQGITMKPALAGEWSWNSDRTLSFYPAIDWDVDQEYTVQVDRTFFPEHVRVESHQYQIRSAPLTAEIFGQEFYQDPQDAKIKKVVVSVRFSHPINPDQLREHITLRLEEQSEGFLGIGAKETPFTVSFNKFYTEAYIHSDPISIPMKDTAMKVTISKGVQVALGGAASKTELTAQVPVPGMFNYFRVANAQLTYIRNERYEPEQVFILELTDGVRSEEIQKNLSVYVLPQDKPALFGQPAIKDYSWHSVEQIGPEILEQSQVVKLAALPTERDYSTLHSFRYEADGSRHLYVRLKKDIKSFGGYILANEYDAILSVPQIPKEVTILHEGSILSLSGAKTLSILTRDVEAIRFRIGRVLPDQINHLVSQSEGNFAKPDFYSGYFDEENITDVTTEIRPLAPAGKGEAGYTAFDFTEYRRRPGVARYGLFFLRLESWDVAAQRTTGASDGRFILVTDLGVLVKKSLSGEQHIFVQSIASGRPVGGARVAVLGKNGLPILEKNTDSSGHVEIPSLADFTREQTPTAYAVQQGDDLSFLPFERGDRRLNLSRFDVGGDANPVAQAADTILLEANLFSDRGLYRPGESFHVGMIVKPSDWEQDLSGIPLEAVVRDARGLEVYKKKFILSEVGFEELEYPIDPHAPTGTYNADLYIVEDDKRGDWLSSLEIRVEEFLPDKLKIASGLSKESLYGWVSPQDLAATVNLQNLFGTPAAAREIAGYLTLSTYWESYRLEGYQDYTFYDPYKAEKSFSEQLASQTTDETGQVTFALDLSRFARATYRLNFTAEGFERAGGRSVVSRNSVLVSPLEYLIGYKKDGDLQYVSEAARCSLHLVAVNSELAQIPVTGLTTELVELRYVSVLTKQPNGTYQYESVQKELPLASQGLDIPKEGFTYALPTTTAGDFALLVKDAQGLKLQRIPFSVVGGGNLTRRLEKNAELQIKLAKDDFAPGEEIALQIKGPYTGAGLITIERDHVYAFKWFQTETNTTVETIRVPEGLEGNAYINVSFVRDLGSPEIYMSPLSYGVVPFTISRSRRTHELTLTAPEVAKPGEGFEIRYATKEPAKIVLFAIDEGILQVAHYNNPDPLAHFFRKRALEVDTLQILDLILPEFAAAGTASHPGGDAEGEGFGKNLNPFKRKQLKPVVYWSGILDAGPEEQSVTYPVPDYFNGTLRVLAVAVSKGRIGVKHHKALVRNDLVLSPNVPTFVAPGDQFDLSVNVTNLVEGTGPEASVLVSLGTSEHLSVVSDAEQQLAIPEGKEVSVIFTVKANAVLGSAPLTFKAQHQNKSATFTIDLSVRPPAPYFTSLHSGVLKGERTDIVLTRDMYPHYRVLEAATSAVPLAILPGLSDFLEEYPYGCTEQLVSAAVPALVMHTFPELNNEAQELAANLEHVLHILQARQNEQGAFGFWAANSHVSNFQTVYALHFLTDLTEAAYPVPHSLLNKGLGYLRDLIRQPIISLEDARTQAYAHYILTRNGQVTSNELNALVDALEKTYAEQWQQDLTGLYLAATYQLLKEGREALKLIHQVARGHAITPNYDQYYDRLSHDSQYLYVVARHFPEKLATITGEALVDYLQPIFDGHYNTISSAYTLLALGAYLKAKGEIPTGVLQITEYLKDGAKNSLPVPETFLPRVAISEQAEKIRFESSAPGPIFYQVTEAGFDRNLPTEVIKDGLEVYREFRGQDGKAVSTVPLGARIKVHLKFRSIGEVGEEGFQNVALVDLLPGGFDVEFEESRDEPPPTGEEKKEQGTWEAEFMDIREDRVIFYGFVDPDMQEYVYTIQATTPGTYQVPPAYAESMYQPGVKARSEGAMITITAQP